MKQIYYLTIILIIMNGCTEERQKTASANEEIRSAIIALEEQAMKLWSIGNPDGFLELSADDVIYMDPAIEHKLEGIKALEDYYEAVRGQISMDSYEIINPVVQSSSGLAILTYNFESRNDGKKYRWNCTEVYRLNNQNEWKIIHTHWSLINGLLS